jgi:steroid delta-isomerase-like uncharacterized protein
MPADNKAQSRRVIEEVWNKGNLEVIDELVARDHVLNDPSYPDPGRGPESVKRFVRMYREAFPDVRITIDDQIAEGDKVVTSWTARGTHRGALMGIPPTGKKAEVSGILIDRFSGGKIAETLGRWDTLGLLRQIGAVPEPEMAEQPERTRR